MPLSEYEQRVLEQMERQLGNDDPKLVSSLQSAPQRPVGRYVIGAFGIVLGVVLLVIGVSTSLSIIGILGFLAMFLGVVFAVSSPRKPKGPSGAADSPKKTAGSSGSAGTSKSAMMNRFEDRWDRRRRDNGL